MPKPFLYIIIVWSIVCASGLGVFLFQVFGPSIVIEPTYSTAAVVVTVVFWVIAWALPVAILVIRGRRQKG
ncbi:MAG: hypothetical protein HZB44_01955 [Actinobacteria bacterium]|nr:hypothetical protein [Actinomycetota bacterium]